ncbi:RNA-binding cell elongation regulator Jag/EloR [Viridibacillus sp. FSL E2-0187]|uniref:RNA-binding cell elongation regulator Jag/EloR n=1 Tax=Viridibacillus TaxID=496496 RepID=UPI00187B7017|nr:RNA-binding cell elongation regulator Jag/EloR [Viridibacillus sp. JNUCC-6]QOV09830.1 protein jag [Viridibacillus sp. JNUCC-6]
MKQITQMGATVEEAISIALKELDLTREQVEIEILQEGKKGFLGFGSRKANVRVTEKQLEKSDQEQQSVQQAMEKLNEIESSEAVAIISKSEVENIQELTTENLQSTLEVEENELIDEKRNDNTVAIEHAVTYLTDIAKQLDINDLTIDVEEKGKIINISLESKKAALLIGKRGQTLNSLQELTQLVVHQYAKRFVLVKLDVENYRKRRQESLEQLANRMADKAVYTGKKIELEPMPSNERKIIHHILANRIDIETYSVGSDTKRYLVIEPIR